MLWTVFVLVMLVWMAGLLLQFRLGAMPIVIVLASILAFVKILRRSAHN
jgi:hypothetical protein